MAKKVYIGAVGNAPIYGNSAIDLTADTIDVWFNVTHGNPYTFVPTVIETTLGNRTAWISQDISHNKTATITLTAQYDMEIELRYSYSSEKDFDKFTLIIGGITIEKGVSGPPTEKSWIGTLSAGQTMIFTYTKDGSQDGYNDQCMFLIDAVRRITGYGERPVAKKIKKCYIGIPGQAYEESTVSIQSSNISSYFTVTNGTYYFVGNGTTFTSNNVGIKNSTATTTLTALYDTKLTFNYTYSTEEDHDNFSITANDTAIVTEHSGAGNGGYYVCGCKLKAGDSITFKYIKDSSSDGNKDSCGWQSMVAVMKIPQRGQ